MLREKGIPRLTYHRNPVAIPEAKNIFLNRRCLRSCVEVLINNNQGKIMKPRKLAFMVITNSQFAIHYVEKEESANRCLLALGPEVFHKCCAEDRHDR